MSLYQLEVVQNPCFVDVTFKRAIEAENRKKPLGRVGLDPVRLKPLKRRLPAVQIDRPILVDHRIGLAADGDLAV